MGKEKARNRALARAKMSQRLRDQPTGQNGSVVIEMPAHPEDQAVDDHKNPPVVTERRPSENPFEMTQSQELGPIAAMDLRTPEKKQTAVIQLGEAYNNTRSRFIPALLAFIFNIPTQYKKISASKKAKIAKKRMLAEKPIKDINATPTTAAFLTAMNTPDEKQKLQRKYDSQLKRIADNENKLDKWAADLKSDLDDTLHNARIEVIRRSLLITELYKKSKEVVIQCPYNTLLNEAENHLSFDDEHPAETKHFNSVQLRALYKELSLAEQPIGNAVAPLQVSMTYSPPPPPVQPQRDTTTARVSDQLHAAAGAGAAARDEKKAVPVPIIPITNIYTTFRDLSVKQLSEVIINHFLLFGDQTFETKSLFKNYKHKIYVFDEKGIEKGLAFDVLKQIGRNRTYVTPVIEAIKVAIQGFREEKNRATFINGMKLLYRLGYRTECNKILGNPDLNEDVEEMDRFWRKYSIEKAMDDHIAANSDAKNINKDRLQVAANKAAEAIAAKHIPAEEENREAERAPLLGADAKDKELSALDILLEIRNVYNPETFVNKIKQLNQIGHQHECNIILGNPDRNAEVLEDDYFWRSYSIVGTLKEGIENPKLLLNKINHAITHLKVHEATVINAQLRFFDTTAERQVNAAASAATHSDRRPNGHS